MAVAGSREMQQRGAEAEQLGPGGCLGCMQRVMRHQSLRDSRCPPCSRHQFRNVVCREKEISVVTALCTKVPGRTFSQLARPAGGSSARRTAFCGKGDMWLAGALSRAVVVPGDEPCFGVRHQARRRAAGPHYIVVAYRQQWTR